MLIYFAFSFTLFLAISKYFSSSSIPIPFLLVFWHASIVVPGTGWLVVRSSPHPRGIRGLGIGKKRFALLPFLPVQYYFLSPIPVGRAQAQLHLVFVDVCSIGVLKANGHLAAIGTGGA